MSAKNAAANASYIHTMSLNGAPFEKTWLSVEQPKTTIDFKHVSGTKRVLGGGLCWPPSFEPNQ